MKTILRLFLSMLLPVALLLAVSISISTAEPLTAEPLTADPLSDGMPPPWDSPHMRIFDFTQHDAGPLGDADPLVRFHLDHDAQGAVTFNFDNREFGREGWCGFHMKLENHLTFNLPPPAGWTISPDMHSAVIRYGEDCIPIGGTLTVTIGITNHRFFGFLAANFFVEVFATRCGRSSICYPTPTPP